MARYRGPSLRLSRREGTDLLLKSVAACTIVIIEATIMFANRFGL